MARQPVYTFLSIQVSSVVSIQLLLIMGTGMGGKENTDNTNGNKMFDCLGMCPNGNDSMEMGGNRNSDSYSLTPLIETTPAAKLSSLLPCLQ